MIDSVLKLLCAVNPQAVQEVIRLSHSPNPELAQRADRILLLQAGALSPLASGDAAQTLATLRIAAPEQARDPDRAGYTADLPIEKLARDAKMFEIGGGTNEIQLQTIARSILS